MAKQAQWAQIGLNKKLLGEATSNDPTTDDATVDDFIIERMAADVSTETTFASNFLMSPSEALDLDPPADGKNLELLGYPARQPAAGVRS